MQYSFLNTESFYNKIRIWSKIYLMLLVYSFWFCCFFFKRQRTLTYFHFHDCLIIYSLSKINNDGSILTMKKLVQYPGMQFICISVHKQIIKKTILSPTFIT